MSRPRALDCDHSGIGLPGCPTCDGRDDVHLWRGYLAIALEYIRELEADAADDRRPATTTGARLTTAEVEALLTGATPGPWYAVGATVCSNWIDPDDPDDDHGGWGVAEIIGPRGAGDIAFVIAAPDLAADLLDARRERDEARDAWTRASQRWEEQRMRLRAEHAEALAYADRLRRILAVEQGDASAAPDGWRWADAVAMWQDRRTGSTVHRRSVRCYAWLARHGPGREYDTGTAPTALEAMEAVGAAHARRAS